MGLKISQLQIPLVIIEITVFFNCIQGEKKPNTCLQILFFYSLSFSLLAFLVRLFLLSSSSIDRYYYYLVISFVAHSFSLFYSIKYTQNDDRSHRMWAPDWHSYRAKS
jgi:hypothetical protein